MRVLSVLLVVTYLSIGDCGVVSPLSSARHIAVAVPTTRAQSKTRTASQYKEEEQVTEMPELTTIVQIKEAERSGNDVQQAVEIANLPERVADDANTTVNGSVFSCHSCRNGYYADTANKCYMFHLCYPVQEPTSALLIYQQCSFVCSDNAVFDQHRVCVDNDMVSYPCSESPNFYTESNNKLIESMRQDPETYSQITQQVVESESRAPAAEASEVAGNVTSDTETVGQYSLFQQLFG